jgi:hypothetical protein
VNVAPGELVLSPLSGSGPDGADNFLFWCDRLEEIPDSHDDDLRLSSSVDDESNVIEAGPPHDLSELSPRRQGGDNSWYRFGSRSQNSSN